MEICHPHLNPPPSDLFGAPICTSQGGEDSLALS